jgi:HlyD family secretion protein
MGRTVKRLLFVSLLVAGVAGVAAFLFLPVETAAEEKENTITFNTMTFEYGTLYDSVGGTGTVQPQEVVLISTERPGLVVQILKDHGDKVREGEELLRLDDRLAERQVVQAKEAIRTAESQVKAATAELEHRKRVEDFARKEYDEYEKGGYTTTQKELKKLALLAAEQGRKAAEVAVEAAKSRKGEAERAVETAELNLDLTRVRMPYVMRPKPSANPSQEQRSQETGTVRFDKVPGHQPREFTIIDRKVSLNQTVGPPAATHLFSVTSNPDEVEILAQINEGDITRVKVGRPVIFSVSALQDRYFRGTVTEVRPMPITVQGSVFFLAVVKAPTQPVGEKVAEGSLRAGMTTSSLDVLVEEDAGPGGKGAWLVPSAALDYTLDVNFRSKDVKKEQLETPAQWKKHANGEPKGEEKLTPRVVWLHDPGKTGPDAARPAHVLIGKAGKFFDAKHGLQDYTQVREWLPKEVLPADPKNEHPEAVISDKKPTPKARWFHLPNLAKVFKF